MKKIYTLQPKNSWVREQEQKGNTVFCVAQRHLYGAATENTWSMPCLHGRHWAALNPRGESFDLWMKRNSELDARLVEFATVDKAIETGMKYYTEKWPEYLGEIDLEDSDYREMVINTGMDILNGLKP